jgi:hypothetical protein
MQKIYSKPAAILAYEKPFPEKALTNGFSVISLGGESDFEKQMAACLLNGFGLSQEPPFGEGVGENGRQNSNGKRPRFRKELTAVIKAPDGK